MLLPPVHTAFVRLVILFFYKAPSDTCQGGMAEEASRKPSSCSGEEKDNRDEIRNKERQQGSPRFPNVVLCFILR